MRISGFVLSLAAVLATRALGQTINYPYYLKTFAGTLPLGDGGAATLALLNAPAAAVADSAGNLYILDTNNERIRKVTGDGKISTFAQIGIFGNDMKLGADGNLYVAGWAQVIKVSADGKSTVVAGTGQYGYSGDLGPATNAKVGYARGIALDQSANIYFTEEGTGSRVRMVTPDGTIRTIAGGASSGFNGDNQPATAATLYQPQGIAVDSSGNIYVADGLNYRIRKFTVGGSISTVAGNGAYGNPVNGPAQATPLGGVMGLYLDASNDLYVAASAVGAVLKITPAGTLTRIAGNFQTQGSPGDGVATGVSLLAPSNVSWDSSGSLYILDQTQVVRKWTSDGNLTTVAGRFHFAGDQGPEVSAILNQPADIALDGQGNVFIADGANFRIRKVAADGTISTWAGTGLSSDTPNGTSANSVQLPSIRSLAVDATGAVYFAYPGEVVKITPAGVLSVVAGKNASGDTGDGGPATSATFGQIRGLAVDAAGNIYIADSEANRVRKVAADTGIISAFAGNGITGKAHDGDGGLATAARLNLGFYATLAVDSKGNVYIGESYNYTVRMVTPAGNISTVVGNGTFGLPKDGVQATSTPFPTPTSLTADSSGNLYIACLDYGNIYRLSGTILSLVSGGGNNSPDDGVPALSTSFFSTGIKVDQNGDLYAVDPGDSKVWKSILNSPAALTTVSGNNQVAPAGQSLPAALKVQVGGRAAFGVPGVTVNFAVTSGSATLGATSAQTDANGVAGVSVTLGAAGNVTVTATAAGTGLPAVTFAETGVTGTGPVITSVVVVEDAVASQNSTLAQDTWIEVHGLNLSQTSSDWSNQDFSKGLPTMLFGVSATVNNKTAVVSYVSPTQVNLLTPFDSSTGQVPVQLNTPNGQTAPFQAPMLAASPTFFELVPAGYIAGRHADYSLVGPASISAPGYVFTPAKPNETVLLYGTGFGQTSPAITDQLSGSGLLPQPWPTVTIGGISASVTGAAISGPGLYQLNVVIPQNAPDGDLAVSATYNGRTTQTGVLISVHH